MSNRAIVHYYARERKRERFRTKCLHLNTESVNYAKKCYAGLK